MIVSSCRNFWFPKCWNQLVRTFNVYLHAIKSTSSLTSLFRCCKDITNLLFWKLWECLTITIKIIASKLSICSKLSCLSACKKINFITQFFLKILQRNDKLIILNNLDMPSHTQLIWYYHSEKVFDVYQQAKINFFLHVSLGILQRCCKVADLGTFGMHGCAYSNFSVYLQVKKQLYPPCFSWSNAKICKLILSTLGMPSYTLLKW